MQFQSTLRAKVDMQMDMQAVQAMVRFGLGRRGQEPVPGDPAHWLAAQLQGPDPAQIASAPSTARGLAALRAEREQRQAVRRLAATTAVAPGAMPPGAATPAVVTPGSVAPGRATPTPARPDGMPPTTPPRGNPAQPPGPSPARAVFEADARAELNNALTTPAPFRERLVWFWTNHFTVSIRQGGCQPPRRRLHAKKRSART